MPGGQPPPADTWWGRQNVGTWERAACEPSRSAQSFQRITVIIPALNEAATIDAAIRSARDEAAELIVADGGSSDDTATIAATLGARVVRAPAGRGAQLAAGAAVATCDVLLFLHADTRLPAGWSRLVGAVLARPGVAGCAFRLSIDVPGRFLRTIERAVAWRSRVLQLPYGDQAIAVRRETYERVGGIRPLAVMEDFDFVRRLKRCGRIVLLDAAAITSGRRWRQRGAVRTTLVNQLCIAAFLLGVSPDRIAALRERL